MNQKDNWQINKKLIIRRGILVTYDILAMIVASAFALMLRYDFHYSEIEVRFIDNAWKYLPYNVVVTLIVFYFFRLYHSLWAYAGITEMQNVIIACMLGSGAQLLGLQCLDWYMPRSYYFMYAGTFVMLILASRFIYRFIRMTKRLQRQRKACTNVMIVGAGNAGNMIIKEIVTSGKVQMKIKYIIDDDRTKWGSYIHGIKVVGGRQLIPVLSEKVDEIIIAMPAVKRSKVKEIIQVCRETKCEIKTLPGMYQMMNGDVMVEKLRKVEIEDLLGRETVEIDLEGVMKYVKNKVVLVTGGGGSIGSEICRQIVQYKPKQLIIVDIYENNAYDIQQELTEKYPELNLVVLIASVRNTARMNKIFATYLPDIVYHAAAHKHVPLMEASPNEAIKNNVLGTLKTVQAADKYGTKKFILISTDKAVNPTNIMGASKRMCEMIIQTYNNRSKTEFAAVRFGNVLGSNGSVVPLFKKQIEKGGPVKVTHPDIIRYFMTIPEAVSLVLQAGANAKGGEIFVLDMGEPVKILDLAENMIRLSGFEPYEDIEIEFTGLRPGEKLYEELLMAEEGLQGTEHELIHIGKPLAFDEEEFMAQIEELKKIVKMEPEAIRKTIQEIVPTYQPKNIGDL